MAGHVALFLLHAADAVLEAPLPRHSKNINLENGQSFLPRVFNEAKFVTRALLLSISPGAAWTSAGAVVPPRKTATWQDFLNQFTRPCPACSRPRSVESEKKCRFVSDTRFGTNRDAAVRLLRPNDAACPSASTICRGHATGAASKLGRAENISRNNKSRVSQRRAWTVTRRMNWMDWCLRSCLPCTAGASTCSWR